MEMVPEGTRSGPTQRRDEETATQMQVAPTMNGNASPAVPAPTVEPVPDPAEPIGALLERERALMPADERAARAEWEAASLRVALAVVTSVAEAAIEVSTRLVDEARRYAQAVADSAGRADASLLEVSSPGAQRVIDEARAAVAQLRADLLEDLADDEPAAESPASAEDGILHQPEGQPGSDTDPGATPRSAGTDPARSGSRWAPGLGSISPPAAEQVG